MQVTIEELGNCKKKLVIEVPAEKVTEELDKRTAELRTTATLAGFRRGHIPSKLFDRRFGKKLREATKNDLIAEAYEDVLKEHNLEPLKDPDFGALEKIELERENPLRFEVELTVKPQVSVEDYVGVKVRAEEVEVTEQDIENMVEQMQRERAELVVVEDRASTKEDMLFVDVKVTAEGQDLFDAKNVYVGVASEGVFGIPVPGIEEKLVGKNRGDSVDLEFELPKTSALEYGEELVGKSARCTMKINEIKTLKIPEATNEWAKEAGFDSLDELKKKVKEQTIVSRENARDHFIEGKVLDKLLSSLQFEAPADLIDARAHEITEYRRYQLVKRGVEQEKIDADLEAYKERSRQEIERNFREGIILAKIAELENLFVTEGEVQNAVAQIAYRRGQDPAALYDEMDSRGLMPRLRNDLLEARARDFLRKKAEVEFVPPGSLASEEAPADEADVEEKEEEKVEEKEKDTEE